MWAPGAGIPFVFPGVWYTKLRRRAPRGELGGGDGMGGRARLRHCRAVRVAGELVRRYSTTTWASRAPPCPTTCSSPSSAADLPQLLLGVLHLDVEAVRDLLSHVLPRTVLDLCETYLQYVSGTASTAILGFSLVFSIYFPMRAANCLVRCVRRAYGLRRPESPSATACACWCSRVSHRGHRGGPGADDAGGAGAAVFHRPPGAVPVGAGLWDSLRFVILALLLFATLGILYGTAQDRRQPALYIVPGACAPWRRGCCCRWASPSMWRTSPTTR